MTDELGNDPTQQQQLLRKLAVIMGEITRVPKRGHNEFHKYDYATEADIVESLRGAMSAQHVVLIPKLVGVENVKIATRNGESVMTTVQMLFTFIDGDSGQSLKIPWQGCGADSGDKGYYKALTGAEKYVLLKTFLIPTGDDPEDEEPAAEKPKPNKQTRQDGTPRQTRREAPADVVTPSGDEPIAAAAVTRLRQLIKTHHTNVVAFKAWLESRFGVTSAEAIKRKDYDAITKFVIEGVDIAAPVAQTGA